MPTCPKCTHSWVSEKHKTAGRKGGKVKTKSKGFGNAAHLAKVLAARKKKGGKT